MSQRKRSCYFTDSCTYLERNVGDVEHVSDGGCGGGRRLARVAGNARALVLQQPRTRHAPQLRPLPVLLQDSANGSFHTLTSQQKLSPPTDCLQKLISSQLCSILFLYQVSTWSPLFPPKTRVKAKQNLSLEDDFVPVHHIQHQLLRLDERVVSATGVLRGADVWSSDKS